MTLLRRAERLQDIVVAAYFEHVHRLLQLWPIAVDVVRRHDQFALPGSGYSRDTLPTELKVARYIGKPMGQSELIRTARDTFKA